jgi:PleD family two-component response regulator
MNGEPQRDQPETALLETGQPETGQPETGQPETGQPETGQPETGQPETGQRETISVPAQANAVTAGQADAPGRHARILILEDEAWDAALAQRLLVGAGLELTAVVVDTKALFIEQLAVFRPEVILSDYHLPGFSGREALKIAQETDPDIPFIIWSGVLGDEAAVELIKQGATDYVLKDRPARLPTVILRALAEAERRARLAQLEDQLMQAQRLASLGQLAAAEEAMTHVRRLLSTARGEATAAEPPS